jgi:hypothetical protein
MKIFHLHAITDFPSSLSSTFDHLAYLLKGFRKSLDTSFEALFDQNPEQLGQERKRVKQFQLGTNIIIANIFKVLRLVQKETRQKSYNYYQIIRRLQKLSDGHRDTVIRSYMHVSNRHRGLLPVQTQELQEIRKRTLYIFSKVETALGKKEIVDCLDIREQLALLEELVDTCNANQIQRIRSGASKTRLSILFYAISGNCVMMAKQNIRILEIFNEAFKLDHPRAAGTRLEKRS